MRTIRFATRVSAALLGAAVVTSACDKGVTEPPPPPPPPPPPAPVTASEWVASVNWDEATTVTVSMVEAADFSTLSYSPNQLTFEAGKPYILRIVNPVGNASKHYFSPKGSSFYQAVATRKIETAEAEYKAPYFDAVELQLGGALELFIVPVLPGTYDIICTIPGHEQLGMTATATITGGQGNQLDLEVADDFDTSLMTDPRRSSSHAVWTGAVEVNVAMFEAPGMTQLGFIPPDLNLNQGVGYKIVLENDAGHGSKHYYTAAEFYKTVVMRKAEDSQAEIKAPYLKAIELIIGGEAELFMVPTKTGTFQVLCTIPGHADLGMKGNVIVQ
ncbi:MAG: plastocyanin/azurin family copper-binding protein [Gemmatimonadota bacterium]